MGVLADLDNTEEAITFHSELPIDVHVDLECHSATLLGKLTEFVLIAARVTAILAIDPSVKDHPGSPSDRCLKIPVLDNMRGRVAISERVVRGHESSLAPEVHSEEREGLILCPAIQRRATNEGVHATCVAERTGEGLYLSDGVRILPVTALTKGTEVV